MTSSAPITATTALTHVAGVPREWLFVATICAGLAIDQGGRHWAVPGEYLVDAAVWLLFVTIFRFTDRIERIEMLTVLAFATPLELLASESWGLYTYRTGLMPLFVPPGHWLLFALGRRIAAGISPSTSKRATLAILPLVVVFAGTGADGTSIALCVVLFAFLRFGPEPRLYVTMVWLALAMEILGTSLGNWAWAPEVPGTALSMTNPPLLCGTAYAFGDLLAGLAAKGFVGRPSETRRARRSDEKVETETGDGLLSRSLK